jgi:hypothetical protein
MLSFGNGDISREVGSRGGGEGWTHSGSRYKKKDEIRVSSSPWTPCISVSGLGGVHCGIVW